MHTDLLQAAELLGVEFFDYQQEYFDSLRVEVGKPTRTCLYYKTGAGKSITSMAGLWLTGWRECVVIAPPATHEAWVTLGTQLGMSVTVMSHAKFRMKTTLLSRKIPVIADEFHLFGGHGGQGWKKLDRLAKGLQAPLVLASATPNYNDAERVYCIQHVLDPVSTQGGYLQFLYTHCITRQNPFGQEPIVEGFKNFKDAAEFLASLDGVFYIEDDTVFTIVDVPYSVQVPKMFELLNVNRRTGRFMASQMEKRHALKKLGLLNDAGRLRPHVADEIVYRIADGKPTLLFCASSTIAESVAQTLSSRGYQTRLVTGSTPMKAKELEIERFRSGHLHILVGTATLATGTDGLDKVCDRLIIVDDTDDDALRRQLIGRILHRGAGSAVNAKEILRLTPLTVSTP